MRAPTPRRAHRIASLNSRRAARPCYPRVVRHVRTFLCHGSQNFEIVEGQSLLVGRGSSCDVVLDDDLASREHFRLTLTDGVLSVEDLGSRNGVLVNGLPIRGAQELHHGDHVTAGRTPLSVVQQVHEPRARRSTLGSSVRASSEEDATQSGSLYTLLEGSTRMALTAGDLTTAEGSGRSLLVALRGFLARGREVQAEWIDGATDLALDLADASHEPVWVERLLDLRVSADRPLDAPRAERLAELVARLSPSRESVLDYVKMARAHPDDVSVHALEP